MRVQVSGSYSAWFEVLIGVPQGSVLGPLLFLIFVRDLPDWVKNSIMMFADDTKVWTSIHKLVDQEHCSEIWTDWENGRRHGY